MTRFSSHSARISRRQRTFLDRVAPLALLAGAGPAPTTADLCAAAEVPRATYFRWCHEPGFRAALIRVLTGNLRFTSMPAAAAALAQAGDGARSFRAAFDLVFHPGSPLRFATGAAPAGGPTLVAARARRVFQRCSACATAGAPNTRLNRGK